MWSGNRSILAALKLKQEDYCAFALGDPVLFCFGTSILYIHVRTVEYTATDRAVAYSGLS